MLNIKIDDNCFFWQFLVGHFSDWPLKLMNIDEHWWASRGFGEPEIETISMILRCLILRRLHCLWGLFLPEDGYFRQKCLEIKYRDSLVFWIINSVEIYLSQDPPRGVLFGKHLKRSSIVLVFRTRGGEYALNEDLLTWLVSDAPNNRFALERLVPNYYTVT